jgi:aminoglycoside phosphotransferase (APT) family kinase protein
MTAQAQAHEQPRPRAAATTDDLAARLHSWCTTRLGASAQSRIEDLARHAEGWSWHTYTFTLRDGGTSRGIAIRRQPEDGLLAPYDIDAQYRLHETLEQRTSVPIPALIALEHDTTVLGMPFYAMERIAGRVPVQWKPKDPDVFPTDDARRALGEQFVAILAAIHDTDTAPLDFLPGASDPLGATLTQLARWRTMYETSVLVAEPLLLHAFDWLAANVPAPVRTGLCHGDYRIGNFIVDEGRIVTILDWELAHVGDVASDVAWAALPLFRGRSPLYSHLLTHDDFLAVYERNGGPAIGAASFTYWTIFNLVKAAVPHIRAARAFEDGGSNDLRLAAMGHQAVHIYKHLIAALEGVR